MTPLALLFASFITLAGISPGKQLDAARDAQRRSDVNTILNAVYQYSIDHNGTLPETIPTGRSREICGDKRIPNCVDLALLNEIYLVRIPSDPQAPSGRTSYFISKDKIDGRLTVSTRNKRISVTR